jgi:hypothetical protein
VNANPFSCLSWRIILAILLLPPLLMMPIISPPAGAQDVSLADTIGVRIDSAEVRDTLDLEGFPDPFIPANGAYLIAWVNVVNGGSSSLDYDYCPPERTCVTPLWFEAVDESGAAFPVDEVSRAAFESAQPADEMLPFGGEIPAGATARIPLVFDIPAAATSWTVRSTDEATVDFAFPVTLSQVTEEAEEAPVQAGMNQVVSLGDIELVVTRAEVRTPIDLPSQPQPFVPQGEYLIVYLTVANRGSADAQYDICPPDGQTCLSQLWFQVSDEQSRSYPVEPIAWSAFSLKPEFLPFGSVLPPGSPEPIALVFDVPAGIDTWWLNSTPDAPHPFSISRQLSPAPGAIQVVREGQEGAPASGSAAIELILDTSGSMLQPLEGQRRIDIARDTCWDNSYRRRSRQEHRLPCASSETPLNRARRTWLHRCNLSTLERCPD